MLNLTIKTVGHRARFFQKMMLNTFNIFDFICIFSYSHLSNPQIVPKH